MRVTKGKTAERELERLMKLTLREYALEAIREGGAAALSFGATIEGKEVCVIAATGKAAWLFRQLYEDVCSYTGG